MKALPCGWLVVSVMIAWSLVLQITTPTNDNIPKPAASQQEVHYEGQGHTYSQKHVFSYCVASWLACFI